MEPIGTFSGIASGIDFAAFVDQITELKRRPIDKLETQIADERIRLAALQDFRTLSTTLRTAATDFRSGAAFALTSTSVTGSTAAGADVVAASAVPGTVPASYQVEVLSLASAEKLSGQTFSTQDTQLNLTGEFFVNGRRIAVAAGDTLATVRDEINNANIGQNATGVTASILTTATGQHRLLLNSDLQGAAGIDLVDTADGLLRSLGFLDTTTDIKHATSSGAESDRFVATNQAIATMLGMTGTVTAQDVTIGGQTVTIDLSADTLDAVAAKIDALSGVSASVSTDTAEDGSTTVYLDVRGTTSFVDAGHTLQVLGILEGGRSAETQVVKGAVLTDGDTVTPATGASLLTNLYSGGGAANVSAGDTFDITGTRGDGTAVSVTYTAGAGDTVDDLLAAINDATNGFGAGSRTATATIDATGRITLTDSQTGDSQLSLSIVTNNEGGGSLDVGSFAVDTVGRDRQLQAGSDATLRLDGVTLVRSSNTVTDAMPGITLDLLAAEAGTTVDVKIERSAEGALNAARDFVSAYNEIREYISGQFTIDEETDARSALHGDATLRLTRSTLTNALLTAVEGAASDLATASTVGFHLDRNGTLSLNETEFTTAYHERFQDLRHLFMELGSATDGDVSFIASGGPVSGSFAVDITAPATRAALTGSGFSGTYTDDATADTLSVTDTVTDATATIALTTGMTTQQIVDSLNTAFQLATQRAVATGNTLYSDAGATTEITAATTLASIYVSSGASANIAVDDTITITATPPGTGVPSTAAFTVTDPTTQTVGDLMEAIRNAFGDGVTVALENGTLVVRDRTAGASLMGFGLTANNENGGALDFGATTQTEAGRGAIGITASASGNEVSLEHNFYGSGAGFTVSLSGGGTDNTDQLGLLTSLQSGTNVAGTIGGQSATGSGRELLADPGTDAAGILIQYRGTTARTAGQVTVTAGLASTVENYLDELLEVGSGLLDTRDSLIVERIAQMENRIPILEARVEQQRASLLAQFNAMETLVGQLQGQSSFLASQIAALPKITIGGK